MSMKTTTMSGNHVQKYYNYRRKQSFSCKSSENNNNFVVSILKLSDTPYAVSKHKKCSNN